MATKSENLPIDIAFYNIFKPYLDRQIQHSNKKFTLCDDTVTHFLENGLIQVSTVFETVMAHLTGSTVTSEDHCDLSNGADCKLSTVRFHRDGNSYSAPVTGLYNKTGTLYVACYERYDHKFYYFAIPYWAYKDIPKKSNIEIPFTLNHKPRKRQGSRAKYSNWWHFECENLDEMAKVCGRQGNPPPQSVPKPMTFASGCLTFGDDE